MQFKIQNIHILGFGSWLNELLLPGKLSVQRTKFVKILSDAHLKYLDRYNEVIKAYTNKEGVVPEDLIDESAAKLRGIMTEEVVLDIPKDVYTDVEKIVLDTAYEFGAKTDEDKLKMNDYAQWCESFKV